MVFSFSILILLNEAASPKKKVGHDLNPLSVTSVFLNKDLLSPCQCTAEFLLHCLSTLFARLKVSCELTFYANCIVLGAYSSLENFTYNLTHLIIIFFSLD